MTKIILIVVLLFSFIFFKKLDLLSNDWEGFNDNVESKKGGFRCIKILPLWFTFFLQLVFLDGV